MDICISIARILCMCYWAYSYLRTDDQLKKIEYLVLFGIMVHV